MYIFAYAYYFKFQNILYILNNLLIMKMFCETKWHTSSIVLRRLFTIDSLFSVPYISFINIDILDKLQVPLSYVHVFLVINDDILGLFIYIFSCVFLRHGESSNGSKINPATSE